MGLVVRTFSVGYAQPAWDIFFWSKCSTWYERTGQQIAGQGAETKLLSFSRSQYNISKAPAKKQFALHF